MKKKFSLDRLRKALVESLAYSQNEGGGEWILDVDDGEIVVNMWKDGTLEMVLPTDEDDDPPPRLFRILIEEIKPKG